MICQKGDICEGCSFDNGNHMNQCMIKNKEKDKDCPCINCLIKIMCGNVCLPYHHLLMKVCRNERSEK